MIHEEVKKGLNHLIEKDRIFHAVIFSGTEGIGKKTLARSFAMAIHCESKDMRPCGVCPSCIKHKTGNHPDYREVYPEKDKKVIGVNVVREAFEDLYIKPLLSDKKIIFIPEADLLEAPGQNAMLKSFEEPPSYGVIILAVKNLSSLLATIKSRAVIYELNPVSQKKIEEILMGKHPEKAEEIPFIASFSGGLIGKAVSLCENDEFATLREEAIRLMLSFPKSRYAALKLSDFFKEKEEKEAVLFDIALSFFRDLSVCKEGSGDFINSDFSDEIISSAKDISKKGAANALFLLSEAKSKKSKNAIYDLWITNLFIEMWEVLNG
ncbi:MAG: hypothetical protein Q4G23_02165 [Clostridia bacterium]|nr:hypothetical protein [Clostridia bacterium]